MPISNFLSAERIDELMQATKVGGATLTGMLGTSAWYAPGAAVSTLVQSIVCDQKKMIPCSVMVEGEYGLNDLCIGVPVVLGRNGIEKILEIELTADEKALLAESAAGVKETNSDLKL
jgi:malate dehydrogenase